jgi:hypothetical protein
MAIHLIADDVVRTAGGRALAFCADAGLNPTEITARMLVNEHHMLPLLAGNDAAIEDYWNTMDWFVALLIASEGHTFLFDSGQMLEFARAVDRKLPPGEYMAPFINVIIQLTEPIPERELLGIDSTEHDPGDAGPIAGLLIRFPLTGADEFVHVFAWFTVGAMTRIAIPVAGDRGGGSARCDEHDESHRRDLRRRLGELEWQQRTPAFRNRVVGLGEGGMQQGGAVTAGQLLHHVGQNPRGLGRIGEEGELRRSKFTAFEQRPADYLRLTGPAQAHQLLHQGSLHARRLAGRFHKQQIGGLVCAGDKRDHNPQAAYALQCRRAFQQQGAQRSHHRFHQGLQGGGGGVQRHRHGCGRLRYSGAHEAVVMSLRPALRPLAAGAKALLHARGRQGGKLPQCADP